MVPDAQRSTDVTHGLPLVIGQYLRQLVLRVATPSDDEGPGVVRSQKAEKLTVLGRREDVLGRCQGFD